MGHYIQSGGVYLTSEKGIIHQFQKKCADESISRIEDIEAAPIESWMPLVDQMGKNRTNLATVQVRRQVSEVCYISGRYSGCPRSLFKNITGYRRHLWL